MIGQYAVRVRVIEHFHKLRLDGRRVDVMVVEERFDQGVLGRRERAGKPL